ncbi:MAG: hypothetical protein VKK42_00055 [Lyngbya sp.]|nr:hypothetical protein [Lyngbya sp.]
MSVPQPPRMNDYGDFIEANWLEWRVITPNKLNVRSGSGFDYKVDLSLPFGTPFSPPARLLLSPQI